jgi:hypothetical protein
MLTKLRPFLSEIETAKVASYLNEALIEKIWQELNGQVPRQRIRQVAAEVAAKFEQATVTTFVPIFIHRYTCERLKRELARG